MKTVDPKLPGHLEAADIQSLVPEAQLEGIHIQDQTAIALVARSISIDEALLEKISLIKANLEKLGLSDIKMGHSDLSMARCAETSMIRVAISDSRMTGLDVSRSAFKDVVFRNCKLDMANFRFSKLTNVIFADCLLSEADFQGAALHQVRFEDCKLEKAEFSGASMKAVDMRNSELNDIRGWQYLKGVTIDSTQLVSVAPQLAGEIGLIVED